MKTILHGSNIKSYKPAFKDTTYLLLIIGFSILTMGELSASSYISVRLKQEFDPMILFSLHINGVKMYSLLLMTNTIIVIIFTYFISKIVMRMNVKTALLIGIIFMSLDIRTSLILMILRYLSYL